MLLERALFFGTTSCARMMFSYGIFHEGLIDSHVTQHAAHLKMLQEM